MKIKITPETAGTNMDLLKEKAEHLKQLRAQRDERQYTRNLAKEMQEAQRQLRAQQEDAILSSYTSAIASTIVPEASVTTVEDTLQHVAPIIEPTHDVTSEVTPQETTSDAKAEVTNQEPVSVVDQLRACLAARKSGAMYEDPVKLTEENEYTGTTVEPISSLIDTTPITKPVITEEIVDHIVNTQPVDQYDDEQPIVVNPTFNHNSNIGVTPDVSNQHHQLYDTGVHALADTGSHGLIPTEIDTDLDVADIPVVDPDDDFQIPKVNPIEKPVWYKRKGLMAGLISVAALAIIAGSAIAVTTLKDNSPKTTQTSTSNSTKGLSDTEALKESLEKEAKATGIEYSIDIRDIGGGYLLGSVTYYPNDATKTYIDYSLTAPSKKSEVADDDKSKEIEKKLSEHLPTINETITVKDKSKVEMATYKVDDTNYSTVLLYDKVPFVYVTTDSDMNMVNYVTTYYISNVQE